MLLHFPVASSPLHITSRRIDALAPHHSGWVGDTSTPACPILTRLFTSRYNNQRPSTSYNGRFGAGLDPACASPDRSFAATAHCSTILHCLAIYTYTSTTLQYTTPVASGKRPTVMRARAIYPSSRHSHLMTAAASSTGLGTSTCGSRLLII
jgi:hypothetical protein